MSAADAAGLRRRGVVVTALGVTQTLAWESTYYLPAVLADPISASLQLPRVWFFGIFSAALLLSGLLGPIAGRVIDRRGGRDVLACTNLIFAVGLVILSAASSVIGLSAAWAVIGVGMGFGLYEAAFATVAGLYGRDARNAITGITLFAGFASTVGWPASALFIDVFGWRGACLTWAALHLALGLPLNRLLVPKASPSVPEAIVQDHASGAVPWTMILLAGVFAASWFISTAMAAHLPRLLQALGATPGAAVAAAALVGPAQVAARLIEFGLLRRVSPLVSARLATVLHPIAAIFLAVFGAPVAALFTVLHGAGNGLLTIARGTLPLTLFGSAGYGLRTGLLSAPARILQGGAPQRAAQPPLVSVFDLGFGGRLPRHVGGRVCRAPWPGTPAARRPGSRGRRHPCRRRSHRGQGTGARRRRQRGGRAQCGRRRAAPALPADHRQCPSAALRARHRELAAGAGTEQRSA